MRRIITVALSALALTGLGVAFAAWTTNGTGSGAARAITAVAVTTSDASGGAVAQLYPGGTGDVKLTINNPNPYPVRITNVTGSGAITSDKGAACNAATGVTFSNVSAAALDVPASASATFTLVGKVAMSNASDTTCQGAVFTIPVSVTGASAA